MARTMAWLVAASLSLAPAAAVADGVSVPEAGACASGKDIERTLGRHGYRVVAAGGSATASGGSVKVQVWEQDDGGWVITEAFVERNRTCVVRAGDQLHMMY